MPTQRQIDFVAYLKPYAEQFQALTGIPAAYVIAQWANEGADSSGQGWWKDSPIPFGIKGKGPSGLSGWFDTWEQNPDGTTYKIKAEFAEYASPLEAFQHLAMQDVIRSAPTNTPYAYFSYLQSHNWATALNYADTLTRMADEVVQIDPSLGKGLPAWTPSQPANPTPVTIDTPLGPITLPDWAKITLPDVKLPDPSTGLTGITEAIANIGKALAAAPAVIVKPITDELGYLNSYTQWLGSPALKTRVILGLIGAVLVVVGIVLLGLGLANSGTGRAVTRTASAAAG